MQIPIIFAYLLDGETHKIGEFYEELARLINPAVAIRAQKSSMYRRKEGTKEGVKRGNSDDWPLYKLVAYGKERQIKAALYYMIRKDYILLDNDDPNIRKWTVLLTDKGRAYITKGRSRLNQGSNRMWRAIRHLHERGLVQLIFKPAAAGEPTSNGVAS